jgi:signal transduction histidine kinase
MLRALIAAVLVAFVIGIAILMATAPPLYLIAERATRAEREAVADACAAEIAAIPGIQLRRGLDILRARHSLAAIEVVESHGAPLLSGSIPSGHPFPLAREAGPRVVTIYFAQSALPQILRNFRIAATVGTLATLAGLVLLILHLVSLVRSERTISNSGATTFETGIRALKGHADELKQMHMQQKRRADELASVSATLVRSLTSGFVAIDDRGLLLDMNQTARELLRIGPDRPVEGLAVHEALGDSAFARTLQDSIENKRTLQRQEIIQSDGERETIIGLSTVPLVDQDGRYLGLIALFTDLTPVRALETRVREMQSLADLGEMSAGIAHEFRNSLSTILGYLKLAQKENLTAEAAGDRLRNAEQEARLLTAAVESLLTFARPLSLDMQRLDMPALIREIVDRLQPLREGIDVEFRGSRAMIDGDPVLLRRAFENVLRNAIEAIEQSGRPGRITVESTELPSPRVTITDNGIGIADEDASRLFLPFRSGKPNGFGLGLALTKKIVLLHGGWIRLSGRPGSGATVTMEFPAERTEAAV